MESLSIVDEQEIIQGTPEQLDTWNVPRSNEVLTNFVMGKLIRNHPDFDNDDDLFGLAA